MPDFNPRAYDELGREADALAQQLRRAAPGVLRDSMPPLAEVRQQLAAHPPRPGQPETGRFVPRTYRSRGRTRLGRWLWRHRSETAFLASVVLILAFAAAIALLLVRWMPPTWQLAATIGAPGVVIAVIIAALLAWARRD